jgi:hypothetical protein
MVDTPVVTQNLRVYHHEYLIDVTVAYHHRQCRIRGSLPPVCGQTH